MTRPYLHHGSAATVGEAIRRHRGVALDAAEEAKLTAFVDGLTDRRFLTDPAFTYPEITAAGEAVPLRRRA